MGVLVLVRLAVLFGSGFLSGVTSHEDHDYHKVVIILFDGFRWDYLKMEGLEGFSEFKTNGAWVEKMTMAFPTTSYPQYYTIMTGLYSESHGIVGNNFYDPQYKEPWLFAENPEYNHTHFYNDGEPMWVTATRQGRKSALYYWPACEIAIRNVTPAICEPYFYWPNITYIDPVLNKTLDDLSGDVDFVGIYVEETDVIGHKYGPLSTELNKTVLAYDKLIKRFMDGLRARNLDKETNVILVSDHGMHSIGDKPILQPSRHFTADEWNRTVLHCLDNSIYPTDPKYIKTIYEHMKDVHPNLHVFLKEDFPDHHHYKNDRRIGPIIFYTDPPYTTSCNFTLTRKKPNYKGMHGYLPEVTEMKGLFLGQGPDFIKGSRQPNIHSIDIYQLMSQMLEIAPAPNNGTWSHVVNITRFTMADCPCAASLSNISLAITVAIFLLHVF